MSLYRNFGLLDFEFSLHFLISLTITRTTLLDSEIAEYKNSVCRTPKLLSHLKYSVAKTFSGPLSLHKTCILHYSSRLHGETLDCVSKGIPVESGCECNF